MQSPLPAPTIPPEFLTAVDPTCTQIVVVQASTISSTAGHLWLLERHLDQWQSTLGPSPVSLGRNGLAWGIGEHSIQRPASIPLKREGDKRTPLGVFRIPYAFGEAASVHSNLPYHRMTPHHAGVDDPNSHHYNQIVDTREVTRDWQSAESMIPSGGSYRLGLFVTHNPKNRPHSGSCIFLHLWPTPNEPTSGCTAMSEETMRLLLEKLHPRARPHLIQFVAVQ